MQVSLPPEPASSNDWPIWTIAIVLFLGLICCIVVGYIGYIGAAVLIVQRSNVNATATSAKSAQIATATAYARATELAKSGLLDRFDSNQNGWKVGKENNQFWIGEINIENGVYSWKAQEFKSGFLNFSDFSNSPTVADFDVYVDAQIINGTSGACSGIIFRKSPSGWQDGGYAMSVCKSGQFFVGYVDSEGKWIASSDWVTSSAITNDWNRIEINARGSHFICKINNYVVYELNDTHRTEGNVALFIEVHSDNQNSLGTNLLFKRDHTLLGIEEDVTTLTTFLFDNFSFQIR